MLGQYILVSLWNIAVASETVCLKPPAKHGCNNVNSRLLLVWKPDPVIICRYRAVTVSKRYPAINPFCLYPVRARQLSGFVSESAIDSVHKTGDGHVLLKRYQPFSPGGQVQILTDAHTKRWSINRIQDKLHSGDLRLAVLVINVQIEVCLLSTHAWTCMLTK